MDWSPAYGRSGSPRGVRHALIQHGWPEQLDSVFERLANDGVSKAVARLQGVPRILERNEIYGIAQQMAVANELGAGDAAEADETPLQRRAQLSRTKTRVHPIQPAAVID